MRTQAIPFNQFMSGEYKRKPANKKTKALKIAKKVGPSIILPIIMAKSLPFVAAGAAVSLTVAAVTKPTNALAAIAGPATAAVPVGAKEWMGEQTLSTLAHVLDPVVDILVALSFPIASVIIVGACFYFMFNNAEKAWSMIQSAGLGYVLIQVSPLILNVLKQVGNAV